MENSTKNILFYQIDDKEISSKHCLALSVQNKGTLMYYTEHILDLFRIATYQYFLRYQTVFLYIFTTNFFKSCQNAS